MYTFLCCVRWNKNLLPTCQFPLIDTILKATMSKTPLVNSVAALGYIALLVALMNFFSTFDSRPNTFLMPLMMISLFTLSAAVMGYLFCFQPVLLYFDGKKKQAVQLFLQTVLFFAVFTVAIAALTLSGIFPGS